MKLIIPDFSFTFYLPTGSFEKNEFRSPNHIHVTSWEANMNSHVVDALVSTRVHIVAFFLRRNDYLKINARASVHDTLLNKILCGRNLRVQGRVISTPRVLNSTPGWCPNHQNNHHSFCHRTCTVILFHAHRTRNTPNWTNATIKTTNSQVTWLVRSRSHHYQTRGMARLISRI